MAFLLTGFGWLVLSSILGLAMLVALVLGTPLPPWVRAFHVHAVLIGGVGQILLGGFLLLSHSSIPTIQKHRDTRPLPFWMMNGGLIGILLGFWLRQTVVVGIAGFLVIGAYLLMIHAIWNRANQLGPASMRRYWYYALAFGSLIGGTVYGEVLAFGLAPQSYGSLRLAHIQLVVLGFIVLAFIGMIHHLLPLIWNSPLASPKLVQLTTILMPIGVVSLIGGFLNSSVPIEMLAGAILFIGSVLFVGNLYRTWLSATHTDSAASDHLLISTFFLLLTIILGSLIGMNSLPGKPVLPYGTLHLVAYTHMAFIGFMVNAIMGGFSYLIPATLATSRVTSLKKRGAYLDQLTVIMNRWRTVQISTLCLGTMGLGILASLTWNVPLSSIYIRVATWACFGFLLTSVVLFSVKLATVFSKQPGETATAQALSEELKLTA